MKRYIEKRAEEIGSYMVVTGSTIRHAAKIYGVSKSTVYIDIAKRLPQIDLQLAKRVRGVLEYNKNIRVERMVKARHKI